MAVENNILIRIDLLLKAQKYAALIIQKVALYHASRLYESANTWVPPYKLPPLEFLPQLEFAGFIHSSFLECVSSFLSPIRGHLSVSHQSCLDSSLALSNLPTDTF